MLRTAATPRSMVTASSSTNSERLSVRDDWASGMDRGMLVTDLTSAPPPKAFVDQPRLSRARGCFVPHASSAPKASRRYSSTQMPTPSIPFSPRSSSGLRNTAGCLQPVCGLSKPSCDECLNEEVFTTLAEARAVNERWRIDYNRARPHSSHGD